MYQPPSLKSDDIPNWDTAYRSGAPPWDFGIPSAELVRVIDEGLVRPMPVLELGCGTGSDAVFLSRSGFDVTAIDSSPTAVERARTRAEMSDAAVRFIVDDVFRFARSTEPFEFVYDSGFYHFIRLVDLDRYVDMLWRVTRPGSLYMVLAGSTEETATGGPPQVSEDDLRLELGRLFEFVELRPFRFPSHGNGQGYLGWSCLMRRPPGVD